MLALMHPEIEFRGMTPGRTWEADHREGVLEVFLGHWFEAADEIGFGALLMAYFLILAASMAAATRST